MHSYDRRNFKTEGGERCLNPCCNGRCTRTDEQLLDFFKPYQPVLILVVMEDALVQRYVKPQRSLSPVLILVVMEDALVQDELHLAYYDVMLVLILVVMEDALVPILTRR